MIIVTIIRYLQCRAIIESTVFGDMNKALEITDITSQIKRYSKINTIALWIGILAGYSCIMVASFRFADTYVFHMVSLCIMVICLTVWILVQAFSFSKIFAKRINTHRMFLIRSYLSYGLITSLILYIVFEIPSNKQLGWGNYTNPAERVFWDHKKSGFLLHLLSCLFEWIYFLLISPYYFTFAYDFARLSILNLKLSYNFIPEGVDDSEEAPKPLSAIGVTGVDSTLADVTEGKTLKISSAFQEDDQSKSQDSTDEKSEKSAKKQ